jgi:hypothetical protein
MTPSGYVLAQNKERVTVITGFHGCENEKTGDMLQTWILPAREDPVQAHRSGEQKKVCGDCPQTRSCYVNLNWAPLAVWRKWKAGGYPKIADWSVLQDRAVRLGAFGDPYFVAPQVWEAVLAQARKWTGYTHQWRQPSAQPLQNKLMASVDTPQEQIEATHQGWRTFRAKLEHQPLFTDEIACPASAEAGHSATCLSCGLCCGTAKRGPNIAINIHGTHKSKFVT